MKRIIADGVIDRDELLEPTGELRIDSPASRDLESIVITSAGNKFIGEKPPVLDGDFDIFAADAIFKLTVDGSFGDISFGSVLPAGLSNSDVMADLTAVGSLAGGSDLGAVDCASCIPEPSSLVLLLMACLLIFRMKQHWSLIPS